jgi:uncharacterized protein (DUF1778 family)
MAAEESLLDGVVVRVSPDTYSAFCDRLERSPEPTEHLKQTMRSKAPWA